MSDRLKSSWGAFPKDIAVRYLKSFGHPSLQSKELLHDVIKEMHPNRVSILDLGCGNANLAEFFLKKRLSFSYTGVDFSDVLLDVARTAIPSGIFINDDVNLLENVPKGYDLACYSHVLEMLPSPESSLRAAKSKASRIVIRFFEPPAVRDDAVELLEMDIGTDYKVPYLRRKMSQSYYELILSNIGCSKVDIYRTGSKDQVHVLHF